MSKISEHGLRPTIIAPGHKMKQSYCYLASVQTLNNRELPEIDLLIIDDFGLKPLKNSQDEDFHNLISERYGDHRWLY
jgi:DNA replication protein DnaC